MKRRFLACMSFLDKWQMFYFRDETIMQQLGLVVVSVTVS